MTEMVWGNDWTSEISEAEPSGRERTNKQSGETVAVDYHAKHHALSIHPSRGP